MTGTLVKEVNGEPWHFAWSTNAFEDRHKEIFSTDALEEYVTASDELENKGFFNFWHIPGTDFARKEFQAVSGRILIETGPYLENEMGQRAKQFFSEYSEGHKEIAPNGWGSSPEYFFKPDEPINGVYTWLWIDRTSTLPREEAANLITLATQEKTMSLADDPDKKMAAIAIFGEDAINNLIESTEKATQKLEESVSFKEEKKEDEIQDKTDEDVSGPETSEEETTDGPDLVEEVTAKVMEQIELNLNPIAEVMTEVTKSLKSMSDEIEGLKQQKEDEQKTHVPKFVASIVDGAASKSDKTKVQESDELLDKKPRETTVDKSGASHFFGAKK